MVLLEMLTVEQRQLVKVKLVDCQGPRITQVSFLQRPIILGSQAMRNYQRTPQLRTRVALQSRLKSKLRQNSLQARLSIGIDTSPSPQFRSTQLLSSKREAQGILVSTIIEVRAD